MNETIELDTITDVKELKSLKSDQYDALVAANDTVGRCNKNIELINQRLAVLMAASGENTLAPAIEDTKPAKPEK